jgi:hypothetical protein
MPNCDSVNQADQATLPGVLLHGGASFLLRQGWYPFCLQRPCAEDQNRQLIPPVSPKSGAPSDNPTRVEAFNLTRSLAL